jgi:hypothetical protein
MRIYQVVLILDFCKFFISIELYCYGLNNPSRYIDPTGHSVECALGEQYCEAGKLNVTKRANDLYRSIKHRDRQHNYTTYWQDLTSEERSILSESNWEKGGFNDNGDARNADALHDPAVYVSLAFGGWASGLFETSF